MGERPTIQIEMAVFRVAGDLVHRAKIECVSILRVRQGYLTLYRVRISQHGVVIASGVLSKAPSRDRCRSGKNEKMIDLLC